MSGSGAGAAERAAFGAIDQGTTSTRAVRLDADGWLDTVLQLGHAMHRPAPGRVEMDARELARNVRACAEALPDVRALALANQGESCLAWDARSGEPLSPVVSWQDGRTVDVLARMAADGLAPEVLARSGLPLDPYFSAAKLGWLLAELPAVAAAHAAGRLRLGTSDAFLLDTLAGRFATDPATASRTGLTNLRSGDWDETLCALFGVPIETLPPILPTLADFGTLAGRPVRAAIVDQQAALYGHGCRAVGDWKLTLGTGAFALAPCEAGQRAPAAAAGLVPTVAWDLGAGPVHALDAAVPDVGTAIDWSVRAGFAPRVGTCDPAAPLVASDGLVALPLFAGLGCPDWERGARPLVLGFGPDTSGPDLARATLEGVAFLCARTLGAIASVIAPDGPVRVDGGVSRDRAFLQALSDLSGRELVRVPEAERTALGAALLAARACEAPDPPPERGEPLRVIPRPVPPAAREALEHGLALARHPSPSPTRPEARHG